jgi:CRISPR/Cas system CSM-associated protein Csm5 (group 7 of RAMP superfamily)
MHFLKDEEALVSHRITHLGGGMGTTSSTLVYSLMQSRRRADKSRKHLLNLEDLFNSNSINLKEYLKSASVMVGKVVGHNKETSNDDQADTNELLPEAEVVDI